MLLPTKAHQHVGAVVVGRSTSIPPSACFCVPCSTFSPSWRCFEPLGEGQAARDVHPPHSTNLHAHQTLVQTRNDLQVVTQEDVRTPHALCAQLAPLSEKPSCCRKRRLLLSPVSSTTTVQSAAVWLDIQHTMTKTRDIMAYLSGTNSDVKRCLIQTVLMPPHAVCRVVDIQLLWRSEQSQWFGHYG